VQFLSALGPRKGKRLINQLKAYGKKVTFRGEVYQNRFLGRHVFLSCTSFFYINSGDD
jgi:transcriptional accessory protein Tex/SPT6